MEMGPRSILRSGEGGLPAPVGDEGGEIGKAIGPLWLEAIRKGRWRSKLGGERTRDGIRPQETG